MGLGLKRICQQCAAKFYDLEKDPITCPKCGSIFDPEAANKPKRGRKKGSAAAEVEPEEIEITLDDDAIEDLDDEAASEELDEEIRDEMELEDEEEPGKEKGKSIDDLDSDSDDIIESDVEDKE